MQPQTSLSLNVSFTPSVSGHRRDGFRPAGRVAAEPLNGAGRCVGGDASTVAMLWNMVYNTVFDRPWPVGRVVRNLKVRALHAVGFEAGFILIGVPIAAQMLRASPRAQAFMLEIGFFLFFLPYTMAYNWLLYERCASAGRSAPADQFRRQIRRRQPGDSQVRSEDRRKC